jgi:DNA-binding CsgD family transcriptional regulator
MENFLGILKKIIETQARSAFQEPITHLTERELDCLIYTTLGMSAKDIGKKLGLSNRTIESYLQTLKQKLGCHSKSQLLKLIYQSSAEKPAIYPQP